jgi:cytochrome c5
MPAQLVRAMVFITGVAALIGCAHDGPTQPAANQKVAASDSSPSGKSGTQLWSENCTRCHNARPSNEYSAQHWDIIVHHMRLRANLTGEEQRKIVEFLQS